MCWWELLIDSWAVFSNNAGDSAPNRKLIFKRLFSLLFASECHCRRCCSATVVECDR